MKKLFLLAVILTAFTTNAQSFKFNSDGTADYVVYTVDKATASDIYKKALLWVNTTYANPEHVIKGKVENQLLKLQGYNEAAFTRTFASGNKAEYGVRYTLEIEIQDGKYRVKYNHDSFADEVYFKFTDVINNVPDKNGNGWNGSIKEYEITVDRLLKSLEAVVKQPSTPW